MAIDKGTNAGAVDALDNTLAFDQRGLGFPRISQGTVDIGAFENFTPALTLSIAPATISEDDGPSAATVTITRNTDPFVNLDVTLSSDDVTEATIQTTVSFGPEQSSVTVPLDAVDDLIADGTRTVTITATADGFTDGTATVDVTDDEVATLTVSITAASIPENGGATTVTVTRNTDPDETLTIDLFSDNEFEATVPAMATFNPGETSTTVNLTAVDDDIVDGTQTVTITASGELFADATDTVDVTDNDFATLTVSVDPVIISETDGPSAATVTITRNTDPFVNLDVTLSSDDVTEATIQTTVSFGFEQSSVTVPLDAVDDLIADGTKAVTITATADGFTDGTATVDVTDDEVAALTVSIAAASIPENGGATTVTVTRNTDPDETLTIDLFSDNEFEVTVPATATFNPGETSTTVNLTAVDDDIVDGTQTVTITASGELFADATDTVDVTDNDFATLTVSVDPVIISETDGPSAATVTITRNTDPFVNLDVTLSSDDVTEATIQTTVSFGPEQSSVTVPLDAVDDLIADGTRTVTITATADGFTDGTATVDVTDDEVATLTVTIASPEISEDPESQIGNTTTVTVTRNTDTDEALTVTLSSDDTSQATIPANLTIPAGQDSGTATLEAVDDAIVDGTRTVTATATALTFMDGTDTVDVIDDDVPTLTVQITPPSISEDAGTVSSSITVTRNTDTTNALAITLSSNDASEATVPATLTIPAGQDSATADLEAVDDAIVDGTQTVTITATTTGFITGIGTVEVTDDDMPTLTLTIADPSISENSGTTTVTVTRNTDTESALEVTLVNGNESDATLPATVTIPAGQATSAPATLTALDNTLVDGDRLLAITATAPGFDDGNGQVQITDDDVPALTLTIADPSISENSGTTTVTVSRNTDTEAALEVTLVNGNESDATLPATVTIPAGQATSATATLTALDNTLVDGDRLLAITATAPGFDDGNGQVQITDDDVPALTLTIADPSISENSGTTTVTVSRNTDTEAALEVTLVNGNESEATLPATVTIPAGQATSAPATLTALDNTLVDGNRLLAITATAPGFDDGNGQVQITDDDVPALTLTIADPSISENSGTTTITVTRNTDTEAALEVTLVNGNESEATLPATVTIPAGQATSTPATLTALDNTLVDGDRLLAITATAEGFDDGNGQVQITDDDVPALTLTIADPSISENSGTTTITVTRNTDTEADLEVTLVNGNESDATLPATVTIPAGQATSTPATLTALDNTLVDGDRLLAITATAPGFDDGNGQVQITDDDVPALTLTIADPSISENSGTTTVTVTRNTDTEADLEVTLVNGNESDATLPATVTIPAGQATSAPATLTALDNTLVDGDRLLAITATAPGFDDGNGQVQITDDDVPALTLTIADPSISENSGTTTVTVTRNTDTEADLEVTLVNGNESDATLPATVTIPAGQATSAPATLTALDNTLVDGDRLLAITATAEGFDDGSGQVQIIDDDVPALTLTIADPSISENSGTTTVTVTRNTDTEADLEVTLVNGNESDATLQATVTIPAGQATSAPATLTALDNTLVDGDRLLAITATAEGFDDGSGQVQIIDDDVPALTLTIADPSISENSGTTTVTVTRNTDTEADLEVTLVNGNESDATLPATVTIPAGQATSAPATLTALDNTIVDGDRLLAITATAEGFDDGSGQVQITDDDALQITLEGGGTLIEPNSFSSSPLSPSETNLTVRRNGTLGDVAVNLEIASGSRAEIGNDFTINGATSPTFAVTIPDGESEVAISVRAIDDVAAEVDEIFTVLLLPGAFVSGNTSASVSIARNDYGVTSLADSTAPTAEEGTLRLAILNAKAGLTIADAPPTNPVIIFQPGLTGEIELVAGAFQLDQVSFSIIGPGSQQVSINGKDVSRIFFVSDPLQDLTYSISGLTMRAGFSATNGGAIFSDESLLLSNCVLSESAADNGGAIANEGSLELDNCTLSDNSATTYGGAIDNFAGLLALRDCTIARNQAAFGGGIENFSGSELWVDSSTFSGNIAGSSGGAIDSFGSFANISNTTISGNQAGFGAGIFNEQGTLSIWQSTIVKNAAVTSVGGILTRVTAPVSTTLHNTIVAGNTQSDSPSDLSTNNSSFVNVNQFSSNNLIGNRNSAGGLRNGINGNIVGAEATSIFRPLGDNGGPTATHALLPGSLAINAGNPSFALDSEGLPLTTDQRGLPRFAFIKNDIGAYETSENPISIVSIDANPGASATIRWTSEAGLSYDVMRSTDLKTFDRIATGITAAGGLTSFTDNDPPLGRAFYVIRSSTSE